MMKRTYVYSGLLALTTALMLNTAMPTPLYAAESDKGESNVTVTFEAGEGPTQPVDPDNPGEPDPGLPEKPGTLVIVHVTEFAFGTVEIQAGNARYNLKTDKPNLQLVDLRGTGKGWKLEAELSAITDNGVGEEQYTLTGSIIHINSNLNYVTAPGKIPPSDIGTDVALHAGGAAQRILTAEDGEGTGLWVDRFYELGETAQDDDIPLVQLEIPDGRAKPGNYNAKITWILYDAP